MHMSESIPTKSIGGCPGDKAETRDPLLTFNSVKADDRVVLGHLDRVEVIRAVTCDSLNDVCLPIVLKSDVVDTLAT